MLSTRQAEAPGPLRSLDAAELRWLTLGHSDALGIAVAAACLPAGLAVSLGFAPRLLLLTSAAIALAGGVAFENLGGILTGATTDVGSGPVLILLIRAAAGWPGRTPRRPCPRTRTRRSPPA